MARFDTSGLDDLVADMRKMGQETGPVAEAMVQAAVIEIRAAWRTSAERHGLRDTGDMIESITYDKPVHMGTFIANDVYPKGKDRKGVRNAEKAFILNYGKAGFDATYWVDEADAAASLTIPERLEGIWNEYIDTGKIPAVSEAGPASSGQGTRKTKT